MVTSAADSGDGSFRAAIEAADLDTTTPVVEIDFALGADSSTTIRPTTALPTITRPVLINGYIQDPRSPRVILDGSLAPAGTDGLTIAGGRSIVEGMDITGFDIYSLTNINDSGGRGILLIGGGGDRIVGDEIGDFGSEVGNSVGIEVDAPDATIGGGGIGLGDVISGNGASHDPFSPIGWGDGILVDAVSGAVIQGDRIGTDPTGLIPDGNTFDGLEFFGAIAPLIGGPEAGEGNVISGNRRDGIDILPGDDATPVSDATIQGNLIGVGADGKSGPTIYVYDEGYTDLGNSFGISANAIGITIGGTTAAERNVVSGNNYAEISVGRGGPADAGTLIQGNFVGTEADGVTPASNDDGPGIEAYGGGTIGGTVAGAGNVVSSNGGQWGGTGIDAEGFVIQGNRIGTDVSGTHALGNVDGVILQGFDTLGGLTPAARNVISGNRGSGVIFVNDSADPAGPSVVDGNFIGVDVTGTKTLGNAANGIQVEDDSVNNQSVNGKQQPPAGAAESLTIGGNVVGAGNVIGGNSSAGISLVGSGPGLSNDSSGTGITFLVQGNSIGIDTSGAIPLPNRGDGIFLDSTLSPATIGGTAAGAGNVIADNDETGVDQQAGGSLILGNAIYGNSPAYFPILGPSFAQDPAPDLTGAICQGGQVTIYGTFAAPAGASRTFEFFAGADSENAGGQVYLGTTQGTADASGRGAFQVTFPMPAGGLGRFLATAIEPVSASEPFGATSGFSNGVTASSSTAPTADLVVAGSGPTGPENPASIGTYTFSVTNNGTAPALGVTLNELFPEGGPLQSATTSQGTIEFTPDGNFVGQIGTLAPGASASITFRSAYSGVSGGSTRPRRWSRR